MSIRDEILDTFGEEAEGIMFADGFDCAVVGVGRTFDGLLCAVYDVDHDEAHEYFDYNIAGSYVGEQTPIFMHLMSQK